MEPVGKMRFEWYEWEWERVEDSSERGKEEHSQFLLLQSGEYTGNSHTAEAGTGGEDSETGNMPVERKYSGWEDGIGEES